MREKQRKGNLTLRWEGAAIGEEEDWGHVLGTRGGHRVREEPVEGPRSSALEVTACSLL